MGHVFEQGTIGAREAVLVDIQCLLQRALNETYGNPRIYEETEPNKTKHLFKNQRELLAQKLGWHLRDVNKLFDDNSKMTVKDFAGALHVLGYELTLGIKKAKL